MISKEQELKNINYYMEDYLGTRTIRQNNFVCINKEHKTLIDTMELVNNKLKCKSCNKELTIIDLIKEDYNLTTDDEAIKKFKSIYNLNEIINYNDYKSLQPKDLKESNNLLKQHLIESLSYIEINSQDLINKLDLRIIEDPLKKLSNEDSKEILIPYQDNITFRKFNIDLDKSKYYGLNNIVYDKFNYLKSSNPRVIFITNNELDTISFYQALTEIKEDNIRLKFNSGSIALNNYNTINLIDTLKVVNTKDLYLIINISNTERGKRTAKQLSLDLLNLNIKHLVVDDELTAVSRIMQNKADFKEFIIESVNNIMEASQMQNKAKLEEIEQEQHLLQDNYINNYSMFSFIDTFNNEIENPIRPIKTAFNELDTALNGGLKENLITIGAITSLGKTSFILQVADQIAQKGHNVLFYSLEMSRKELMAKSISRNMYINSNYDDTKIKSTSDIINNNISQEKELFIESLEDYKNYSKHLFIKESIGAFGVDEIRKDITDFSKRFKESPIVIIDYLQMLSNPNQALSDKAKVDNNILELKRLTREFKTSIIVISSLNRESYNYNVALQSFKESGAIEYTSDIVLSLDYDLIKYAKTEDEKKALTSNDYAKKEEIYNRAKADDPRQINLKILKNRNGLLSSVKMIFKPKANLFLEVANQEELKTKLKKRLKGN
jgi:replicative DNA helicase